MNWPDDMFRPFTENELKHYREEFQERGRLQIPEVLSSDHAEYLHQQLVAQSQWNLSINDGQKHSDLNYGAFLRLAADQRKVILENLYSKRQQSLAYAFKAIPAYDVYHNDTESGSWITKLYPLVNEDAFLAQMRAIIGDEEIGFADVQVSCYEALNFLGKHDDNVAGKNRSAAYVLNLTKHNTTNEGGQLNFLNNKGELEASLPPTFNSLNIFKVPQQHEVSRVAEGSTMKRFAISGWLRTGADPKA